MLVTKTKILYRIANIMENSRFVRNVTSTIEELRPSIGRQPGITLGTLLNIQERVQNLVETVPASNDNFIITVEDVPTSTNTHNVSIHGNHQHHEPTRTDNFLNNTRATINEVVDENQNNSNGNNIVNHNNNNNGNNMENNLSEAIPISPRTHALFKGLENYITFGSILLTKGLYDYSTSILNILALIFTFYYSNDVVKREIAKQNNKSWLSLLFITFYIVGCLIFVYYEYDTHIFSPYTQPLTIWELLWSVFITDFVLKLITIIFKVFLTCLPSKLLALQKRGKYFFMVEATSQLYRCVAPVQPWFYYFFESYQGREKIFGIGLSFLYTVNKGNDLLSRFKLFQTAIWKLLQNVNLGVSPSKEQLVASGGICAICHDQYSVPVRLHCKHIFCETCVVTWLNRECSCPLCRAAITDDPIYRDGHTTYFIQLY